jgi:hypothetical protein
LERVVKRAAVTVTTALAFALAAAHASAGPSPAASCVATITSAEGHLAPGFVGSEVSSRAPVGALASNLAQAHLGSLDACRAAEK